MKATKVLFGVFTLLMFTSYGQSVNATQGDVTTHVTEFKMESDNLSDLKSFDWNTLYTIFETNAADAEINLAFAFTDKVKLRDVQVNSFEFKVRGKTSELEALISESKEVIASLRE